MCQNYNRYNEICYYATQPEKNSRILILALIFLSMCLVYQVPIGGGPESQGISSQVPAAFRNFSLSQKERTLNELVHDKWLCATSDGRIGLGVRSFLDLRSWFRNNDVPACDVCNEAGVKVSLLAKLFSGLHEYLYLIKVL